MSNLRERVSRRLTVLKIIQCPADAWLFLLIALFALVAPLLFRIKLTRLHWLLTPTRSGSPPDPQWARKVADLTDAAMRLGNPLIRPVCTTRGLTLYYFLRRRGVDVELRFGVAKHERELAGHCWLVRDGKPFLETRDPEELYTPIYSFTG